MRHRLSFLILLALTGVSAAGCSAVPVQPLPDSTPPISAEQEAFEEAERTYRAYIDALNAVVLSEPATFDAVLSITSGDARSKASAALEQMHNDGWTVSGHSRIEQLEMASHRENLVELSVCLDVSAVTLVDQEGLSQVDADRPDVQSMQVTVELDQKAGSSVRRVDGVDHAEIAC